MYLNIEGSIQTQKTHDEWINDFVAWLESRGENFGGVTSEEPENVQDGITKQSADYHRGVF